MTPEEYLLLLHSAKEAIVAQDLLQWRINKHQLMVVRSTHRQDTKKWTQRLKNEIMLVEKCLGVESKIDISLDNGAGVDDNV